MHTYLSKEHVCLDAVMVEMGSCGRNHGTKALHFTTIVLWNSLQASDIGHTLLFAK